MIKHSLHRTRVSVLIASVLTSALLGGCQSTGNAGSVSMPEVVIQANTELLSAEEKALIGDARTLSWFNLTPDKLQVKLAEMPADEVKAYVSAMAQTVAAAKFKSEDQPKTDVHANGIPEPLSITADSAAIPLNTDAGSFNRAWVLQPALFDQYQREPGPFSLKRYLFEKGGIPTFADAPVAIRPADLVAGKVDVAFVGVPLALGSGWRDSKHAPTVMRGMYGVGGYSVAGGVDPDLVLSLVDYGDIAVDNMSAETTLGHVQEQIGEMLSANVVPFVVGGDQTLMLPTISAVADHYGSDNITVLHLDAHYRGQQDLDHFTTDQTGVANLLDNQVISGSQLIQLGLRGDSQDKAALTWLREHGVKYHTMAQVDNDGWQAVLDQIISEIQQQPGKTYISFNMSVMDPAEVTGSGQPVPGGLRMRQVMTALRRVCAESEVAGFEMLGVSPYLDVSYHTALAANQLMHACLTGIAMRKEGLTSAGYIDPMALSHGQP